MSVLLLVAALATGVMGFAIQRGATCTVVAIGDIVHRGHWSRTIALAEAALWVAALMLIARRAGVTMVLPPGFAPTLATVAGGVLLGLGAVITGACVFGAVARLGSGDWAFAATPVGFYLGCVVFGRLMGLVPPARATMPSAIAVAPCWLAVLVGAVAVWRLARHASARVDPEEAVRWHRRVVRAWTPYTATLVIGVCFVVVLLAEGPWAYTDALAEFARGHDAGAVRLGLFFTLLAGAIVGGWSAGLLGHRPVRAVTLARCLGGGALMALGSLLIPGSNDGLILLGLPLLQPYAWLAFGVMAATVAVALRLVSPSARGRRSAAR